MKPGIPSRLTEQEILKLQEMWNVQRATNDQIAAAFPSLDNRNKVSGVIHRLRANGYAFDKRDRTGVGRWSDPERKEKVAAPVRTKPSLPPKTRPVVPISKPVEPLRKADDARGHSSFVHTAPKLSTLPLAKSEVTKSFVPHMETTNSQCRWPIGDPRSEDFGCCGSKCVRVRRVVMGREVIKTSSYCKVHYELARRK